VRTVGCLGMAVLALALARPAAAEISLDRYLPTYDVSERHQTDVKAPVSVTYAAARELDLQRSGIVRAILKSRQMITGDDDEVLERRPFLDQVHAMGWGMLREVPGRALVFGAVAQPWESHPTFHALSPEKFAAFQKPGWAKIIWTVEVDPAVPTPKAPNAANERSVFRTRMRVATTDATSRRKFQSYWGNMKPAMALIRQQALGMLRSDAERRARAIARVQQ
jgi:hypothetical protein